VRRRLSAYTPGPRLVPIEGGVWGPDTGAGRQILPSEDGRDGFFYALLHKAAAP
jgi:16S rRNA (cytosine967-C5)-methyltransferase